MNNARVIVVICPHRPEALLNQALLGHVGWGYEYPDGTWCIGGVEGVDWQGISNGFWVKHAPNLDIALTYFSQMKYIFDTEYDYYKLLSVSKEVKANWEYADKVVAWIKTQKYNLFGRNCMNSTYDILCAYASSYNDKTLASPHFNWIPNGWFNTIETDEYYFLPSVKEQNFTNLQDLKLTEEIQVPQWRKGKLLATTEEEAQWEEQVFIAPKKI
ncbi:MAG: hypothetical protein DRQ78_07105 [Epsilonproteobacteria bacterium]|nr:MAG: hypothetical protein DRQ78_07105 [Campylobacterota bacterium]